MVADMEAYLSRQSLNGLTGTQQLARAGSCRVAARSQLHCSTGASARGHSRSLHRRSPPAPQPKELPQVASWDACQLAVPRPCAQVWTPSRGSDLSDSPVSASAPRYASGACPPPHACSFRPTRSVVASALGSAFIGQGAIPRGIRRSEGAPSLPRRRVTVAAALRKGLTVTETDKLPPAVRDAVLSAVERLGGRVTVGDAASAAGVSLADADRALKALAADASGFLEVSDEGDVLYCFPRDARVVLAQNSLRVRVGPWLKKAQDAGSYLLRVSFGTALIVSIAVVYTAIAALLSSQRSDNDRGERRGGYYGGPSLYINMSDFFWYWDPFYYERLRSRLRQREMSFVESIFSFVFGDGDPNEGLDEARWQAVGELIASKGGVVTAQEVAPFLDLPRDYQESEAYMLPVVQRFDGYPEVDEQGNILYRFPQLQRTAKDWVGQERVLTGSAALGSAPGPASVLGGGRGAAGTGQKGLLYFARNFWEFSGAPKYKQFLAAGLGVVNLVGVLYLSFLVRDPAIMREVGSEFVRGVVSFLPFLQAYATAFFAIPALRFLSEQRRNEKILEENERREESALQLARPSSQLKRKLASARQQAERVVLDAERVIYSSGKDLSAQALEGREWDGKLERSRQGGAVRQAEESW